MTLVYFCVFFPRTLWLSHPRFLSFAHRHCFSGIFFGPKQTWNCRNRKHVWKCIKITTEMLKIKLITSTLCRSFWSEIYYPLGAHAHTHTRIISLGSNFNSNKTECWNLPFIQFYWKHNGFIHFNWLEISRWQTCFAGNGKLWLIHNQIQITG